MVVMQPKGYSRLHFQNAESVSSREGSRVVGEDICFNNLFSRFAAEQFPELV